jgi:sugar/nucleoside kinase (ribokinase family)
LAGAGIVGDDEAGSYIVKKFDELGVDTERILKLPGVNTSYTDVMTEHSTGNRTFFHYHGANDIFSIEHINVRSLNYKIFHFGYLALLGKFDDPDKEYGTVAARLLKQVHDAGLKTSVDVVSVGEDVLQAIVPPVLNFVDYLIINEIEISAISGITVRNKDGSLKQEALKEAVEKVSIMGNIECIVVHLPEGSYIRLHDGTQYSAGSLKLPGSYIKGTVGAGDAYCAGMLYGVHENWKMKECMNLAACCAASSLSASDANSGMKPLRDVLKLAGRFGFRAPPVVLP